MIFKRKIQRMKAVKQRVEGVGWVVFWKDGYEMKPLRNFGDWQYAAIEFAKWLNMPHENQERIERNIKLWAETYNPANKYQAPIIKGGLVELKKQREYRNLREIEISCDKVN